MKEKDIRIVSVKIEFIPLVMRIPLKFGSEISTGYDTARATMRVENRDGRCAEGVGESPLSPAWAWPSIESFSVRLDKMRRFCRELERRWNTFPVQGHPMEIGHAFLKNELRGETLPELAKLTCCAPFDMALHDAYGNLYDRPIYDTYNKEYMNRDLAFFYDDDSFRGLYPENFFVKPPQELPVWHLVGGKDLLRNSERNGSEPDDGYPVILEDWIRRDGLKCLKIKLTGLDAAWDYERLVEVGRIALEYDVQHLSTDFNCMVEEPAYVNSILDRLLAEHPKIHNLILYVEQPFPYELKTNQLDVRSVSARKPLFMDESAHDWKLVRLGQTLGWTGVALKTCKTQTGALLSACWARKNGMTPMVQDLTNPRLAVIPHVQLAAHIGTIMGVECNAMQFYPDASKKEARVHPGLYRRNHGMIDLSTLGGPGFGMRLDEIEKYENGKKTSICSR